MIALLTGIVAEKKPPVLVLDVSGVGYELEMPLPDFFNLPEPGEKTKVFTHMIVREDAMLLYGFLHPADKTMFSRLTKINGVGAKMALAILSGLNADKFSQAVRTEDITMLTTLPGIGKKTAERLIIEMKDKITALPRNLKFTTDASGGRPKLEAVEALISLGFKPREADKRVNNVAVNDNMKVEEIIRLALKGN